MRTLKIIISVLLVLAVLVCSFYFLYMRPRYTVPILMYHSISYDEASTLSVAPENFTRQIGYLHKKGYKVISLDKFVERMKKGDHFPHNTVVITFDDGFVDNYTYAFPALVKYKMPATVFLITGYMGSREKYLNWDQVRLMADNGIDFGAHTRNDVYLPAVKSDKELMEELTGSKADIEKALGKKADYFCYPIGGFNEKVKEAVKDAGYKGACTTNRGYDKYNRDAYELNRIKVTDSDMTKPFHFRAKLSGYYDLFRSPKGPE